MGSQTYTIDQAMGLAVQHHVAGRLAEAEQIYRQILQVVPNHPHALHNLGEIAFRVRQFEPALDLVGRAITVAPGEAVFHNTQALVLFAAGRADESLRACRRALELDPNLSHAHTNLGICHAARLDLPASIAAFERAIALDPENPNAHDGLGLALLTSGDLGRGWREQEWRWRKPGFEARREFGKPQWDGSDLSGRSIFLHVEQGYGDVIQFCRYVPLLAGRGAKVYLEVVPEIAELMASLDGLAGLVPAGQLPPEFDFVCPLMSVPLRYGTTLETIPARVPYLAPDASRVAEWRRRLEASRPAPDEPIPRRDLKVGLAWAGRPTHSNDHNRSTSLSTFAPLADVPGVTLYGLQKGDAAGQALRPPPGMKLVDLSPRLNDFSDTAAVLALLDLVIAVDTSVAHLAGALARPVWTLLPHCPDWRWMLGREDTPWYPTMRLFRAARRGDWAGVMERVKEALAAATSTATSTATATPGGAATREGS